MKQKENKINADLPAGRRERGKMVKISINGNEINVSDAQAYAINLILSDYQSKHKLARTDERTFNNIKKILKEAVFLSDCDKKEIYKATIYRNAEGKIQHNIKLTEEEERKLYD